MTKAAHIPSWVMLVMGALILIAGIILGEWTWAVQDPMSNRHSEEELLGRRKGVSRI